MCLLIVTTAPTTDTRSLVMALTEVFGTSGASALAFPVFWALLCVGFASEHFICSARLARVPHMLTAERREESKSSTRIRLGMSAE